MPEVLNLEEMGLPLLLKRCRKVIERGGLVVLPTDTVYGLAARADDPAAVKRVCEVKGRDAGKALVVMISSSEEAAQLIAPEERQQLARLASLWPGPLTLVVRASDVPWGRNVAPASTRLGMRIPANPFLLKLLHLTGPLAVTSANMAGGRASSSFRDMDRDLLAGVDLAIDGGDCGSGKSSTVAELCEGEVKILRQGEITERDIYRALKEH
jgi:L-threonylcarbamoyladenylate synthase